MKVLLVEDDPRFITIIQRALGEQHYLVEIANDGESGLKLAESSQYNLILLDLNLPKLNGIEFCQRLRSQDEITPILVITVDDSSTTKVKVLDAGADDYIVKPFNLQELLARIRALIRRAKYPSSSILNWHGLTLEAAKSTISYQDQELTLEPQLYALLELFLRNPHRIFSQHFLLEYLWSNEQSCSQKILHTYVNNLRQTLKQLGLAENLIENIYGLGYRLKSDSESKQATVKITHQKNENSRLSSPKNYKKYEIERPEDEHHLQEVWHKYKHDYYQRLDTVANALNKLHQDYLTADEQEKAIREAHTLAGALGMFGFHDSSQQCREIENNLKSSIQFTTVELEHLEQLLFKVKQEIYGKIEPKKRQSASKITKKTRNHESPAIVKVSQNYSPIHSCLIPSYLQESPYILVIDDDRALTDVLCSEAILWGFKVNAVSSLAEARNAIASFLPNLVLLDINFPETKDTGLTLLEELSTNYPIIPVIIMTGAESFEKRLEVARLGGQGFLQKPVTPEQVMSAIVQILEQTAPPVGKLMIVNDDSWMLYLIRLLLEPWGFQLTLLEQPQKFWEILEQSNPDLLIIDLEMGNLNGIDLCRVVRNDPQWYDLPIIVLSSNIEPNVVEEVFTVGADDYVRKPIVGPELISRVLNRLEKVQMRRKIAETDDLTRVCNRRKSVQEITRLIRLADRQHHSLCFVILDLDHFKQINDDYGHEIGDQVLKTLGKFLNQSFRGEDVVGRWGGEEFVIGLYGTRKYPALARLNTILKHWSQQYFSTSNDITFSVTFSAGLAEYPADAQDLQSLYRAADLALYQAKAQGRNRVSMLN